MEPEPEDRNACGRLEDALAALGSGQRRLVEMFLAGCDVGEIADRFRRDEAAVVRELETVLDQVRRHLAG